MAQLIPSRDFGFQIDWSGKRLCKEKHVFEDDIVRIGTIHFDDENGFCVYCRKCGVYMECDGEDFNCPKCNKWITGKRLLDHFNRDIQNEMSEDLYEGYF